MKERGCVFIDRDNARSSLKAINQAIQNLKLGHSMAIFPEGTRSKGPQVGDFKSGSLRIAIKSGVKVIPVSIKDSYKLIGKKGKIHLLKSLCIILNLLIQKTLKIQTN